MLDEYATPNVGMIMYGFFWVKYGLWLKAQGLDPTAQSELLLWVEQSDGSIEPAAGALYYSLLLVYANESASNIPGRNITKGWIFAKQPSGVDHYATAVRKLDALADAPASVDGEAFVEAVIAPWLRTRCEEADIDLAARFEAELAPAVQAEYETEQARFEASLAAFTTVLGEIFNANQSLHEGHNTTPIDQPFDISNMLWAAAAPEGTALANDTVQITQADVTALFSLLEQFEQGRRMLHSFIFFGYLGADHTDADTVREIFALCRAQPTALIEGAATHYSYTFDPQISEEIIETSFVYEVNYILAEAETIARKLLAEHSQQISLQAVEEFFEERRGDLPIDQYERFVAWQAPVETYLPWLIERYADTGEDEDVVAVLEILERGVAEGRSPAALLIDLLTDRGVLEPFEFAPETYKVLRSPSTESSATFYGVGSMEDYAAELMEATHE
ncbi:hypothetical protein [Haloglomus halophilum]|uniref:hypothetical protein n=1 Tax=Haloglomus halophilum TaxID=2962672 RepID=UPI0020C9AB3E|nr:hypothetical protein [Haloglomus halophilum]